ncbi:MAG: PKD domain-containing protein, partial [Gemmatimonadetes bacterium]|nr:PKD domain-containing protein [Gemmatimonadota bacterium]NIQ52734.1 PKD domain-containing protein [Gemmatimonadota bacterium]NIU77246.1 PKD domain-containing protein [Gammaproteobacteria bacterium]NIX46528.1 PKD domain-containing protein [Gemmatimonadota bacterium]NIY10849.1 PKD domain-containing protein [Gemmatimonadota bacterium]
DLGGGTPTNSPPASSFTYDCTDLACDFTDTSTDSDGSIASWSWDFGDGATSTAQHPSHTYAAGGTYTVSL